MNGKKFITDLGLLPVMTDEVSGETIFFPRYALWEEREDRKPAVVETSDVLSYLLSKYRLADIMLYERGRGLY